MILNLKGHISQGFQGKRYYLGLGRSKLKAAHPVNYFPWVLGKNIENFPPSKLLLFTSLLRVYKDTSSSLINFKLYM